MSAQAQGGALTTLVASGSEDAQSARHRIDRTNSINTVATRHFIYLRMEL
jgi:hypothetical protein